jgi:hypothetical protein
LELRFTFISHGVGWRRGAILRRLVKRKTRKKAEKNAVLRSAGFEVGEGVRVEGELAEVLRGAERRRVGG